MIGISPICLECLHFHNEDIDKLSCDAFTHIPDIILSGDNNHSEPLPKQGNDIVFEKKK